jgi:hypothetical protein
MSRQIEEIEQIIREIYGDFVVLSDPTSLQKLIVMCKLCRGTSNCAIPASSGESLGHLVVLTLQHAREHHQ